MAQTSEGKRKTKNKAKAASPMRAQGDNQLRDPPIPAHSSEREPRSVSRTSSVRQSDSDMDSLATGPSDGTELARYDDSQLQSDMESDDGEGAEFPTHATYEADDMGGTNGEDIRSRIAERAFLMYADGGFQHGHDLDHWLEAERDIMKS